MSFPAYHFARALFKISLKLFCGFRVAGIEKVPSEGGLILVSNHQSYLDPIVVGCASPRKPVRFMARASLWDSKIIAIFNNAVGTFPVKRGGADRQAWKRFEEMVSQGEQICFFPEGTRSPDGNLQEANPGSGMLIHRCKGAQVIPVRVFGTGKIMPKGKVFAGFHQVKAAFGDAIDLSQEWNQEGNREIYEVVAKKTMQGIAAIQEP
jgi:1-acyl-sn-glycerol-3-phosphate acyltransferase